MVSRREQKAQRIKRIWMSIFLSALMVMSVMGVYIGSNQGSTDLEYNGFTMIPQDGYLAVEVNNNWYYFYSYPADAVDTPVPASFLTTVHAVGRVRIAFEPDEQNAPIFDTLRLDLVRALPVIEYGVTEPSGLYNFPVFSCDNATIADPVIEFRVANETRFSGDERCLVFHGNGTNMMRLRDSFLYQYVGVVTFDG